MKLVKLLVVLFLTGCVTPETKPEVPTELPPPVEQPPEKCLMVEEVIKRAQGDHLIMPFKMPMAHEAHYLVKSRDRASVSSVTEKIGDHMFRTCALLQGRWKEFYPGLSSDCRELYRGRGATEWTPAEGGGQIGRGVGLLLPSVECEASLGTMYWASGFKPPYDTRFIAINPANGRGFVACMGYEAGPGDKKLGGGLSTEALYYLGAKHAQTPIVFGRAVDQTLPYGPVECAR